MQLLANLTQQVYQMGRAAGFSKEDGSSLVKVYEALAGVKGMPRGILEQPAFARLDFSGLKLAIAGCGRISQVGSGTSSSVRACRLSRDAATATARSALR